MKISFDFDNTLSKKICQETAKFLIEKGFDVCITTSRYKVKEGFNKLNEDLFSIAEKLNIKDITFTNFQDKTSFLVQNNVDIHIDDDSYELESLQNTSIIGIQIKSPQWRKKLFKILSLEESNFLYETTRKS